MSLLIVGSDNFIAQVTTSLYFYFGGKNWRDIYFVTIILPIITFAMSFLLPESPRYLYSKNKYNELDDTMKYIARINGVDYRISSKEEILKNLDSSHNDVPEENEYSILDDLRKPRNIANLLIMMLGLSIVSSCDYMLMAYIKYLGGNIFINNIFLGVSTISSCLTSAVFKCVFQNKYNLAVNTFLSLIFTIPLLFDQATWIVAIC